jgi:hypothetical protein
MAASPLCVACPRVRLTVSAGGSAGRVFAVQQVEELVEGQGAELDRPGPGYQGEGYVLGGLLLGGLLLGVADQLAGPVPLEYPGRLGRARPARLAGSRG